MTLSFLLTIYVIFLITYSTILGFAVYKVFMFAKNKVLKGYSRRMTLVFLITTLFIVFVTFLIIKSYNWNDSFGFYCKQVMPTSCFCETNAAKQKACRDQKDAANNPKQSTGLNNSILVQLPKT